MIESQKGENYRAHQGDERLRRDQQLLHETIFWHKIGIFVNLMRKVSVRWKELKRCQGSTFDTIGDEKIGRRPRYYP